MRRFNKHGKFIFLEACLNPIDYHLVLALGKTCIDKFSLLNGQHHTQLNSFLLFPPTIGKTKPQSDFRPANYPTVLK